MHRQLGGNSPHENSDRLLHNNNNTGSSRTNISFLHPPPPPHPHHPHNEQSSFIEDKWSSGGGDLELYEESGGITYRLPDSESSRTVSRPELVVEGLQEMCNLVKHKEPEIPSYKTISRFRLNPLLKISSPPIPPPTAFHAGAIDEDEEEDEEERFQFEPNSRENFSDNNVDEESFNVSRVLHRMMSHVSGFDENDRPKSSREEDKVESSCQCDFERPISELLCLNNDKSTSTSEMPNFHSNSYSLLQFPQVMNGVGQQASASPPFYILQPAAAPIQSQCQCQQQQQPMFLYGGSPGSQNQAPIFLQQVQFQTQQQGHNMFHQGQMERSIKQSQELTLKATRVETTTSSQPINGMSRYAYDRARSNAHNTRRLRQHRSTSPPISNLRKKQQQEHLAQKPRSDRKGHNKGQQKCVSGGKEVFIVGPSPIDSNTKMTRKQWQYASATESGNKMRNCEEWDPQQSSHSDTNNKRHGQQTRRQQQKGQDYYDDDEEDPQQNHQPRTKWTLHKSNQETDISDKLLGDFDDYDEDENLEAATPSTSSHTIVIKTGYKEEDNHHPYITSSSDAIQHDPVTTSESNSSVEQIQREPSPPPKIKPPKNKSVIPKSTNSAPVVKVENVEIVELEVDEHPKHTIIDLDLELADTTPGFMRDRKREEKYDHLEKSLAEGIAMVEDTTSWEKNVCGLKVITLQLRFQESGVLEHLPLIVSLLQKHIRASGSKLARQAILTLRELFAALGPHFDAHLNTLAERLFSKMANTNKFIKEECQATLEAMVSFCSQPKMIQILESVARRHKHAMIRLVACRMVTRFITLVEPNVALQDYADLIIPLLCSNLAERTREVRDEARNAIKFLITNPSFDSYLRQYVSPQFIYSICDKLERIREEVSGKPMIKRKMSRNQCMFKWQQNDTQNQKKN